MNIKIPCINIKLVPRVKLKANNYNPNHVSYDKMNLLKQSIIDNGFCYPIITIYDEIEDAFIIIDGFHRYIICQQDWLNIEQVPVIVLDHNITRRMAATVQFNKARGVHQIDLDADIIKSLIEQGLSDEEISIHLGIDIDTIHRYKQITGISELFKKVDYSMSWEVHNE